MAQDNSDLLVSSSENFDSWMNKYNIHVERTSQFNEVGVIEALDDGIPSEYKTSLVAALNYVYSIRVSEGQPLTNSIFTDCIVPNGTALYFGPDSKAKIKAKANTYGTTIAMGYGDQDHVFFTYDGSVGIAVEDPQALFHCNGTAQVNEFVLYNPLTRRGATLRNSDVQNVNFSILDVDSNLILNNSAGATIINRGGGRVGIGYSSVADLTSNLNIKSSNSFVGIKLENSNDAASLDYSASGFSLYTKNTLKFRVDGDGNVGIGQDVMSYKLHVAGSIYGSSVYFGSELYAGASVIAAVTDSGQVNLKLTAAGTLTHGAEVIVDADGKIDWSHIKNFVDENGEVTQYTDSDAIDAVTKNTLPTLTLANNGTLKHGTKTIIDANGSITTTNISEGNKLFFTEDRVVDVINGGEFETLTLANNGTLKHGVKVIVDVDGKIDWSHIKNFVDENGDVTQYTDSDAIDAVTTTTLSAIKMGADAQLTHGAEVIIDADGKIDWSHIKNFDDGAEEVTQYTDSDAVNAVSTITVPGIKLSDVLTLSGHATTALNAMTGVEVGAVALNSTIGLPVFFNGTSWATFDGVVVEPEVVE